MLDSYYPKQQPSGSSGTDDSLGRNSNVRDAVFYLFVSFSFGLACGIGLGWKLHKRAVHYVMD
jgi:hypothetical protein